MNSEILKDLAKDDLLALVLAQQVQTEAQAAQIGALTARIVELEARLGAPRKTPGNSSTPPSKGRKPNRPERPKTPRFGTEQNWVPAVPGRRKPAMPLAFWFGGNTGRTMCVTLPP